MKQVKRLAIGLCSVAITAAVGCGGGSSTGVGSSGADFGCDGNCANQQLTAADVTRILQQGVASATALGMPATLAVVDRVGNVLAVYVMPGASPTTTINGRIGAQGGLEGAAVPAVLAAISKAGTGAYLSSQGNAFSTRTAGQIVQETFNPGERFQAGGPLFGVQFSQLICSDVTTLNPDLLDGANVGSKTQTRGLIGPRPMPLGLSADPGGIPIYKQGDVVGGLGIEMDALYSFDRSLSGFDDDPEERVALTATLGGFETPADIAGKIHVLGKSLRYVDLEYSQLDTPVVQPLDPSGLTAVGGFSDGTIRDGAVFGEPSSGIAKTVRAGIPAAILVNEAGAPRFPTRAGSSQGGQELQANEVDALLDSSLTTAFRMRAGIRRPLDTAVRVSIWVVDVNGEPLGFVRSEDAPVFGTDVSLQKARSALFFSRSDARDILIQGGFGRYVEAADVVFSVPTLSGAFAFSDRAIGNLSRPFFPDGIEGDRNGPFSLPFPGSEFSAGATSTWSPFNTGLQLDLAAPQILAPLSGVFPDDCVPEAGGLLKNGLQIFAGSISLYRGNTLIGAIGISGDGIDQDDMVAFYGASRPGLDAVGHTSVGDGVLGFNAPNEMRSDRVPLEVDGIRLRYVGCPEAPFRGSNAQNVCEGL